MFIICSLVLQTRTCVSPFSTLAIVLAISMFSRYCVGTVNIVLTLRAFPRTMVGDRGGIEKFSPAWTFLFVSTFLKSCFLSSQSMIHLNSVSSSRLMRISSPKSSTTATTRLTVLRRFHTAISILIRAMPRDRSKLLPPHSSFGGQPKISQLFDWAILKSIIVLKAPVSIRPI